MGNIRTDIHVQFDPAVIEQARQIDLLSYLQRYEPSNLKRVAGNVYCTREHDSLKISNGKWYWWSRGIGGYSALDYLMKVQCLLRLFLALAEGVPDRTD